MNKPYLLIESIIDYYKNNIDNFKLFLYKNNIYCKEEDDLLLIYNNFDTNIKNNLCKECRSIIINKNNMKIIAYTNDISIINSSNDIFIHNNSIISECYEGTLLSVYYHNNKWYISSRKCIDSKKSLYNNKSYYDLFEDVIINSGYSNIKSFTDNLDINKTYYFILIHYLNKNIIDYKYRFGENYKYLCLSSIKDSLLNELDLTNINLNFINKNIFINTFYNYDFFEKMINDNYKSNYNLKTNKEGIIIKSWNYNYNKFNIYKLQYKNYQYHNAIEYNNNLYNGLLYLYQNDELSKYIKYNPIFSLINSFNILEVINSLFKVLTSELLVIFKKNNNDKNIIKLLPYEYKNILYDLKNIYYYGFSINKNSKTYINNLTLNNIYNYLKGITTINLINLLKKRNEVLNISILSDINYYCSKIQLEYCDLFINKLFFINIIIIFIKFNQ